MVTEKAQEVNIGQELGTKSLVLKMFDSMKNTQICNFLEWLSTEEIIEIWEILENQIKESEEIKKLASLRKNIIFYLLNNKENALIEIFVMENFPWIQLWKVATISKSCYITACKLDGTQLKILDDEITLEKVIKLYNKMKQDWGDPKKVIDQLISLSNVNLEIKKIIESIWNIDPENTKVSKTLGDVKQTIADLIYIVEKKQCI